jgi:prepilin-type N-terminal cleavage/methylation domain-containing protein
MSVLIQDHWYHRINQSMRGRLQHNGFSLTETLLAVAALAIGLLFVGGTFLTGIHFSIISTEQTIAAVVAEEAFAKVRLYGIDFDNPGLTTDRLTVFKAPRLIPSGELMYPSSAEPASQKQYCWAALCKRIRRDSRLVQVTVLVSRKAGSSIQYWGRQSPSGWPALEQISLPWPILVNIVHDAASHSLNELSIKDAVSSDHVDERTFINDGNVIIDNGTGQIYRVLERSSDQPDRILLDRPWQGGITSSTDGWVWVVSPPVGGGSNPCIAVYQRVIRF